MGRIPKTKPRGRKAPLIPVTIHSVPDEPYERDRALRTSFHALVEFWVRELPWLENQYVIEYFLKNPMRSYYCIECQVFLVDSNENRHPLGRFGWRGNHRNHVQATSLEELRRQLPAAVLAIMVEKKKKDWRL